MTDDRVERAPEAPIQPAGEPHAAAPAVAAAASARRPRRRSKALERGPIVMLTAAVIVAAVAATLYFLDGRGSAPPQAAAVAPAETAAVPVPAKAADPAAPPKFTSRSFGDWVLLCPVAPQAGDCALQQRLASAAGATALIWTIQRDAKGVLHASWQVPATVAPQRGFAIDAGNGDVRVVPFVGCSSQFCLARAEIAPDYLGRLQAAPALGASVVFARDGQVRRLPLSSKGLGEALTALSTAKGR